MVAGMSVRDGWRQKENLGEGLAPLLRAPTQGAQATGQEEHVDGASCASFSSCASLPMPPRPMSKKGAPEREQPTVLPKPVLPTARACHLSPTSGVVGGRGGRGTVAQVVASDVLLAPSLVPLASVGNEDSDVGGFFLTGLFVHDTPVKGEEHVQEGQQEHLSASSKLCEKMQNIVLMRDMRASGSGSESEGEVEQAAAPDVCPLHTVMQEDDGGMQQEKAGQVKREREAASAAPASALREEHLHLAEQRAAEQDRAAKAAAEKAAAAERAAAANQAATEAAEQMLAQLAWDAAAAAEAEADAARRGKEEAAAAQKEKDERTAAADEETAAERKAAAEATGAPAIKASKAREQSPAQAKTEGEAGEGEAKEGEAKEGEAKPAPAAASRRPEEDHAAAARQEEEETAQERPETEAARPETEAANRAATEADEEQEQEEESWHEEALDMAKVQREMQESVQDSARRVCAMREELTTYLHQLQAKSVSRPPAAGDEGLAGELQEDALIDLPANFKEVVAAAEALAMHESERPHVRRACDAGIRHTWHGMFFASAFFASASSSTASYVLYPSVCTPFEEAKASVICRLKHEAHAPSLRTSRAPFRVCLSVTVCVRVYVYMCARAFTQASVER